MDALRATLDSTDGQVATVSRTSSPPPLDLLSPPPVVAEYWCHTQVIHSFLPFSILSKGACNKDEIRLDDKQF